MAENETESDVPVQVAQPAPQRPPTPLPLRSGPPRDVAAVMPARPQSPPEVVRRTHDYVGRDDRQIGGYGESNDAKRLIVGRDIALSGQISACEKLVVEGHVEANMNDCHEIEVAETGTFKGEANIDIAEICGVFEGKLAAHELLIIRSTGRVTGSISVGRLEVERGGVIEGDIQVERPEAQASD